MKQLRRKSEFVCVYCGRVEDSLTDGDSSVDDTTAVCVYDFVAGLNRNDRICIRCNTVCCVACVYPWDILCDSLLFWSKRKFGWILTFSTGNEEMTCD